MDRDAFRPVNPREIANRLLRGAQRIEQYGWVRNKLGSDRVGYCIYGSIIDTTTSLPGLTSYISAILGTHINPVEWNDNICGSAEECMDVLLQAASAAMGDAEVMEVKGR